jgi:hypothetical protein
VEEGGAELAGTHGVLPLPTLPTFL